MIRSQRRSKMARRRSGTALLEFTMILPLFMFLSFFAVDMGRMVIVSGALNDSAYVAARSGAQRGGAVVNGVDMVTPAFDRAIEAIPGMGGVDKGSFEVQQGTCNNESSYIVVTAYQDVPFITPGLGRLLSLASDGETQLDTTGTWRLSANAAVLCEVVR